LHPSSKKLVRLSFFFGISVYTNYQEQKQVASKCDDAFPAPLRLTTLSSMWQASCHIINFFQYNHTRQAQKHYLWGVLGAPFRECKPPNMSSVPLQKHPSWVSLCSTPLTEHENTQCWCFCARRPRSFTFFICVFSATSMYIIFNLSL